MKYSMQYFLKYKISRKCRFKKHRNFEHDISDIIEANSPMEALQKIKEKTEKEGDSFVLLDQIKEFK